MISKISRLTFLLIIGLTVLSCSKEESPLTLTVAPQSLLFKPDDTSHELTITSDASWEITEKSWAEWISISPLSGKGNGSIQVIVNDNNKRNNSSFTLSIKYSGQQVSIPITV